MKKTFIALLFTVIAGTAFSQHVNIQTLKGKETRVYVGKDAIAFPYYSSLKEAKKVLTAPEEGQRIVTGKHPQYNFWIFRKNNWVKIPKL